MQQNLASRSNKYSYYFFFINFFPRLPGAAAPIFAFLGVLPRNRRIGIRARLSEVANPQRGYISRTFDEIRHVRELRCGRVDAGWMFLRCLKSFAYYKVSRKPSRLSLEFYTTGNCGGSPRRQLNALLPIDNEKFVSIFFFQRSPSTVPDTLYVAYRAREKWTEEIVGTFAADTSDVADARKREPRRGLVSRVRGTEITPDATSAFSTRSRVRLAAPSRAATRRGLDSRRLTR